MFCFIEIFYNMSIHFDCCHWLSYYSKMMCVLWAYMLCDMKAGDCRGHVITYSFVNQRGFYYLQSTNASLKKVWHVRLTLMPQMPLVEEGD